MAEPDSLLLPRIAECCDSVVAQLGLNLAGVCVLTECATGAYCSTAVLAAFAGAKVYAYGRDGRHGKIATAREHTHSVATRLGVGERIHYLDDIPPHALREADIVTNSGHLRPLDSSKIRFLRAGAVVALMYEAWEFRKFDVDIAECFEQGVRVVGTNEHHPNLKIFNYLGLVALRGLFACHVPVMFCRILVLSDNMFAEPIVSMLRSAGAEVDHLAAPVCRESQAGSIGLRAGKKSCWDAAVIAMTPRDCAVVGDAPGSMFHSSDLQGTRCIIQIWGDLDRQSLAGVRFFPSLEPAKGHMGVLLNEIGPDPVVRLQAGGLRAASECLFNEPPVDGVSFAQRLPD